VFSLSALESKLVAYVKDGDAASQPFDISSVPKMSREQAAQEVARTLPGFAMNSSPHSCAGPSSLDTIGAPVTRTMTPAPPPQTAEETQSSFAQQLGQVPELTSYGAVLNSSRPVQLTEKETEYQVSCIKHVFREHIVFQVSLSYILSSRIISETFLV
jgi:coatomer subunit gamma